MLKFILFIFISNVLAILVVLGVEFSTGFFGLQVFSDFAFFVAMLIWGIAALFFIYSPSGGGDGDLADRITGSMVDSSIAHQVDEQRFSDNTKFCILLFVSGLPAFVLCVIM
jgi:hypothetical protein